jgi:hypothetical protein
LLPLTLVVEGGPPHLTLRNLGGFAYLTVVATGVAFVLWFNGIRKLPAAAAVDQLAAPVTRAVLGWLVLDQSLSSIQLMGFAILSRPSPGAPPARASASLVGRSGWHTPTDRVRSTSKTEMIVEQKLRIRVRLEVALAIVGAALCLLTVAWPEWIEEIFGIDPMAATIQSSG